MTPLAQSLLMNPLFTGGSRRALRLGVLYQKLGRWSDSRIELQKFLGYWSHADRTWDLPGRSTIATKLARGNVPTAAR